MRITVWVLCNVSLLTLCVVSKDIVHVFLDSRRSRLTSSSTYHVKPALYVITEQDEQQGEMTTWVRKGRREQLNNHGSPDVFISSVQS